MVKSVMVSGIAALVVLQTSSTPVGRYEMGVRLKLVEAAWGSAKDPVMRKQATTKLTRAVFSFFQNQYPAACEALDDARVGMNQGRLGGLDSLCVRPETLVGEGLPKLRVYWAYPVDDRRPISITVTGSGVSTRATVVPGQEQTIELRPLNNVRIGNGILKWDIVATNGGEGNGKTLDAAYLKVSDLAAAKRVAATVPSTGSSRILGKVLSGPTAVESDEMLIPAAEVLGFKPEPPTEKTPEYCFYKNTSMRLFIPKKADPQQATVLIAFHGAGGSENMFAETYGRGMIFRRAAEQGWIVVSPNSTGAAGPDVLEYLAKQRGITIKNLIVMGHSMGGAVALSSGSWPIKPRVLGLFAPAAQAVPDSLKDVPTFLAVGKQEIGMLRGGIIKLASSENKRANFEFREYEACEHMMVVNNAIPAFITFVRRELNPSR